MLQPSPNRGKHVKRLGRCYAADMTLGVNYFNLKLGKYIIAIFDTVVRQKQHFNTQHNIICSEFNSVAILPDPATCSENVDGRTNMKIVFLKDHNQCCVHV